MKTLYKTLLFFSLPTSPSIYSSFLSTIFSLSGTLLTVPFLLCLRRFSSLRLIAANSSVLINPAFLMTLGSCLCRSIRLSSGMCLYRSRSTLSYSRFSRSRAVRIRLRSLALARHRRMLPSSEPERRYFVSVVKLAEKTLFVREGG